MKHVIKVPGAPGVYYHSGVPMHPKQFEDLVNSLAKAEPSTAWENQHASVDEVFNSTDGMKALSEYYKKHASNDMMSLIEAYKQWAVSEMNKAVVQQIVTGYEPIELEPVKPGPIVKWNYVLTGGIYYNGTIPVKVATEPAEWTTTKHGRFVLQVREVLEPLVKQAFPNGHVTVAASHDATMDVYTILFTLYPSSDESPRKHTTSIGRFQVEYQLEIGTHPQVYASKCLPNILYGLGLSPS